MLRYGGCSRTDQYAAQPRRPFPRIRRDLQPLATNFMINPGLHVRADEFDHRLFVGEPALVQF